MDILRGRLAAVEGGYHKALQEEELREYRRRRVREGAFSDSDTGLAVGGDPGSAAALSSSDKLAEIHAAEARTAAPLEALRLRTASLMPPGHKLNGATSWVAAGALSGGLHSHHHRPSLGRGRWAALSPQAASAAAPPALAEETAAAAAKRAAAEAAMRAGARALAYGSAAAVVGLLLGGRLALRTLGIESEDGLRDWVRAAAAPAADRLRARAAPWAERATAAFGGVREQEGGGGGGRRGGAAAELAARLRRAPAFAARAPPSPGGGGSVLA